jgi:hypothetical protein
MVQLAAAMIGLLSAPSLASDEVPRLPLLAMGASGSDAQSSIHPTNDVLRQQVGLTLAAAAVSVPASFALGGWTSTLSGNLVLSALPALLIGTLVPPLFVSVVAWLTGNSVDPGRFSLWPSLLATTAVSIGAMVASGFLGMNANEPGRVAVFTAVEAALLPTAALATMHLTAPSTAPQVTVARIEF